MRSLELAVLYGVIGAGCAIAMVVWSRGVPGRSPLLDVVLLVPFWPLYAPFLLLGHSVPNNMRTAMAKLGERVVSATERVAEIDRLLADPDFNEHAAVEREQTLLLAGDARAASAARARLASIRRLRKMRDRFMRELTEVDELLAQLRVQTEVVRIAGSPDDSARELVAELVGRLEGLDAILEDAGEAQPSESQSSSEDMRM